jgi:hypothetical protein
MPIQKQSKQQPRDTMADLRITSMQGAETVLKETAIEGFSTSLRGELLRSADAGYDAARKVWNAMIDKHPALIVLWKYYQTSPRKCVTEVTYAPVTTKPGKLPTIGILGASC